MSKEHSVPCNLLILLVFYSGYNNLRQAHGLNHHKSILWHFCRTEVWPGPSCALIKSRCWRASGKNSFLRLGQLLRAPPSWALGHLPPVSRVAPLWSVLSQTLLPLSVIWCFPLPLLRTFLIWAHLDNPG